MGQLEGNRAAYQVAEALYKLGFPWDRISEEGFEILKHFDVPEDDEEGRDFLHGAEMQFHALKVGHPDDPPLDYTQPDPHNPSEYMVVDELIESMSELTGDQMPWVGDAVLAVLDRYDAYIASLSRKAWDPTGRGKPGKLQERADRIRHSVVDLEMKAAGRA